MAVMRRMSHDLQLGRHFSRHLYCDAFLTKDGLRLIPVHRNILAAVSNSFAKIFQQGDNKKPLVVPVVDFETLEKVVNYIYRGSIEFFSVEDYDNFNIALNVLRVDLNHKVDGRQHLGEKKTGQLERRPGKQVHLEAVVSWLCNGGE